MDLIQLRFMTTSTRQWFSSLFQIEKGEAYTKSGRRKLLGPDLLRFLSVIAIVWWHGKGPGQKYLEASLYALILLSVILPTIGSSRLNFGSFFVHRAKRLLIPYAFFWLFYGILALVRGQPFFPTPWILIEGHGWHLWYLPYAFFASVIAFQLNKLLLTAPARTVNWFLLGLSMVLLFIAASFLEHHTSPSRLANVYTRFAPTIPMGVLIGRVIRDGQLNSSVRWLMTLTISTLLFTGLMQFFGLFSLTLPYCTALILVSAALLWQQGTYNFMLKITGLAMSIYLLHPFIGLVLLRLGIPGLDSEGALLAAAMILTSIPVGWMATKTPVLKLFVK
jgi:peptidoglycan/LPS O-acetylase OafA/YrhL